MKKKLLNMIAHSNTREKLIVSKKYYELFKRQTGAVDEIEKAIVEQESVLFPEKVKG